MSPVKWACGVCLDGSAPCPIVEPPNQTQWTCLACGRYVGHPSPAPHQSALEVAEAEPCATCNGAGNYHDGAGARYMCGDCDGHGFVPHPPRKPRPIDPRDAQIAQLKAERDAAVAERDAAISAYRIAQKTLRRFGTHKICGGIVEVADSGVGSLRCLKCEKQDWSEGDDYEENLLANTETPKDVENQRSALRAALVEACEWWESHLTGLEKHVVDGGTRMERSRIAQLKALAGEDG
jgi:hypothetical protein